MHVLDPRRPQQQHDQAVEAERAAGAASASSTWRSTRGARSATSASWRPGAPDGSIDLASWIFDPDGLGPYLRNRDEVLPHMARRLAAAAPHWAASGATAGDDRPLPPVLSLDVAKDGVEVRMFTTTTTLGEPQDIALHDIRIECFFPADAASRAVLEGLAKG